ncbi:MAG: hypothetical protein ACR2JY_05805 [Chloroflexota bacterium]
MTSKTLGTAALAAAFVKGALLVAATCALPEDDGDKLLSDWGAGGGAAAACGTVQAVKGPLAARAPSAISRTLRRERRALDTVSSVPVLPRLPLA